MGRRSMVWTLSVMLVATMALSGASPAALANGAPITHSGRYLGAATTAAETPVGIESERLFIRLRDTSDILSPLWMRADVSATYVLHNPTQDTLIVSVLFVGDLVEGEKVVLDGRALPVPRETEKVLLSMLDILETRPDFVWFDPWTGETYPLPDRARGDYLDAIPFTLELAPGTHELQIDFENGLGRDNERYLNPVHHLTYLLQPARQWAYFRNLDIRLELPHDGYRLVSSLPLTKGGKGTWVASFPSLPEQDLYVSVVATSGMWLGRFTTKTSIWLLLLAVTLLPEVYRRFLRRRVSESLSLGLDIVLRVVAIWFAWNTLTRGLLTVPFNGVVQVPVLAGITIWLVWGLVKGVRSTPASERKAG